MGSIETGIDKLVILVKNKKKVSFKDAAKLIAAPLSSIEQWAHILEETGLVTVSYKLAQGYIEISQASEDEQEKSLQKFHSDKNIFLKKLEATANYFEELDEKIVKIEDLFKDMEGHLDKKFSVIGKEIAKLTQVERQKEQLDEQIIDAKKRSETKLQEVMKHLRENEIEYKDHFKKAEEELQKDEVLLEESNKFLQKMRQQEKEIEQKLKIVQELSAGLETELAKRQDILEKTEERISHITKNYNKLKSELQTEHNELRTILNENVEKEKTIQEIQKEIFEKMTAEEKLISAQEEELKSIPDRFKTLLERKKEISDILQMLHHEEDDLKRAIQKLTIHAKSLHHLSDFTDAQEKLAELEKQLGDVSSKKSFFKDKITSLLSLLDWDTKNEKRGKNTTEKEASS